MQGKKKETVPDIKLPPPFKYIRNGFDKEFNQKGVDVLIQNLTDNRNTNIDKTQPERRSNILL